MAQKFERTAFAVSNNLKAAMQTKGIYPVVESGQTFYSGAANDIHLAQDQQSDGSFRTTNITGSVPSFDFIDPNDATLSRIWSRRELDWVIAGILGVSSSDFVLNVDTYTHTIVYNSISYTGVDTSLPDAKAKALIKVVNQLPNGAKIGK